MKLEDFTILEDHHDANALFRAFSYSLFQTKDRYNIIRQEICNYLKKIYKKTIIDTDLFIEIIGNNDNEIKKYIREMEQEAPPDNLEIVIFSKIYHKKIIILHENNNVTEINNYDDKIYLYLVKDKYNLLIPKNNNLIENIKNDNTIIDEQNNKNFDVEIKEIPMEINKIIVQNNIDVPKINKEEIIIKLEELKKSLHEHIENTINNFIENL